MDWKNTFATPAHVTVFQDIVYHPLFKHVVILPPHPVTDDKLKSDQSSKRSRICLQEYLFLWRPLSVFYGNLVPLTSQTSYENAGEPGEMHASWDAWLIMTFREPLGFFNALIRGASSTIDISLLGSSSNPMNGIHGNSNKGPVQVHFLPIIR